MMLVAMPSMPDNRFARSVIYLCAHSDEGAMGLVVNNLRNDVDLAHLAEQLGIESDVTIKKFPVFSGGPVENSRGFLLHSPDLVQESTLVIDDHFALTATVDVLKAVMEGRGPKRSLFALGYAGWAAGQLENELQQNGWLLMPAADEIVFDDDASEKWQRALRSLGVEPTLLSGAAGHA